jgi:peptidoglycan/xylan/chitin deacetylase (PgdA/CDA1 family)
MSTTLFEQEMRLVSRHYKIVSLGDAVRRLAEGGPSEPVISITFDDGYQDNYLNAFPILQRYGLPATIFLTTGSIDSREPLWFEKLALAFKKTSLESIDLEIDIPRRFWMRTEAERLQANGELYQVLRGLADEQRQQWLSEILARLGGREDRERNDKMLTWEQTRLMQKNGIDFGGHTVNHPFVSRLQPEQGGWEISECKRRIEAELQIPVKHFAYPSGREQDVAEWNKKLVQQAGYEAAVSTKWGVNDTDTDRLEMRRGGPWEENPALFAAKLDWYQWVNG